MDGMLTALAGLDGAVLVGILGLFVFAESAALLGLLVPGELILLVGGAAAASGRVSALAVVGVGMVAAISGEAAGYALGQRFGARVLARAERHPRLARHLPRVTSLLQDRGAVVVVLSRWASPLRALVPLLAGSTRMPYRRFTVANVAGGVLWVALVVWAGYAAASSLEVVAARLGFVGAGAMLLVVLVALFARRVGIAADRRAIVRWAAVSAVLAGTAGAALVHFSGVDAVRRVVADVRPGVAVAAIALEVLSLMCLIQVYRATFRTTGRDMEFREAFTVTMGAFGLAQLLPGGGAVGGLFVARRLTRHHGTDPTTATLTVVLLGLITMGTLGVVATTGATFAALSSPGYARYAAFSLAATITVLLLLILVRTLSDRPVVRRQIDRLVGRVVGAASAQGLDTGPERTVRLLDRPAALLRPAAWSALNWGLDLVVLAMMAAAAGVRSPVLAVVVAYGVANLINAVPVTPGGVGLVETGIAGTLIAFGADPASASVAAIGYRLVAHWIPLLVSAPAVAVGLRRPLPAVAV